MTTPAGLHDTVPTARRRAVIATGTGRYADPWHPYTRTSPLLAEILEADGWDAVIDHDVDHALAHLEGTDLLVVNAGDPWRDGGEKGSAAGADEGLEAAIARGIGIVAIHAALSSLRDYPRWREAIGGEWDPSTSWHPEISDFVLRTTDTHHPVTRGMPPVEVYDERYSDLVVDDGVRVLGVHDLDDVAHPVVWARETPTRAVVSALGHDERTYASTSHRELLRRAARWAARID